MVIEKSTGEVSWIMMADLSDDISDLKKYYNLIQTENIDAVFGSRFISGSKVVDYPFKKLILNRIFNYVTKFIFLSDYNYFTNAFKIYKKESLKKHDIDWQYFSFSRKVFFRGKIIASINFFFYLSSSKHLSQ